MVDPKPHFYCSNETLHGEPQQGLDPNKVQICRVNPVAYDNGQPCACPVATCNLWRGGMRPAGAKEGDRG